MHVTYRHQEVIETAFLHSILHLQVELRARIPESKRYPFILCFMLRRNKVISLDYGRDGVRKAFGFIAIMSECD